MKRKTRATVADWTKLHKTGKGLATTDGPGSPTVTLWPHGERRIWVKTADGLGLELELSEGPHGLAVRIYAFGGPLDNKPNLRAHSYGRIVEVCQYRDTPEAQAFARWYAHEETPEDVALLGPSYRRAHESEE